MTYGADDYVDYGPEQTLEPGRRRSRWKPIAIVAALAAIGLGSAFIWRGYGRTFPSFAFKSDSAAGLTAVADGPVTLKDFQAFQQQIAAQMQTEMQLLESQQAEMKRLSDQAADLTATINTLKLSSAAMPAPPPPPVTKKSAPKQNPANISTGGAPLPVAPKPQSR